MANEGQGTTQLPTERLMTRDLVTVTPQTSVTEAMELMTRRRVRHLPGVAGGGRAGRAPPRAADAPRPGHGPAADKRDGSDGVDAPPPRPPPAGDGGRRTRGPRL